MGTVKIVSLDVGNTLIRLENEGFCTEFRTKTGAPREKLRPLFFEHFLTKDQPLRDAVYMVCKIIGYDNPQTLVDEFKPASVFLFDDTIPALEEMSKAGVAMIATSNCTPWEAGGLESLGLDQYLKKVFYSYAVGAAKPDPAMFIHVQDSMGTAAENILHVGDNWSADVEGALAAGWRAVFLARDGETPVRECNRFDVPVIRSLRELPEIVMRMTG